MKMHFSKITIFLMHFVFASAALGTQINIINLDGTNEGFNDNTSAAPVGGNIGTTLGQRKSVV